MKNLPTYKEFINESKLPEEINGILKHQHIRKQTENSGSGILAATLSNKYPKLKVYAIIDYEYGNDRGNNLPSIKHYVLRYDDIYFDGYGINNRLSYEKSFGGTMEEVEKTTGLPVGKIETQFIDLPEYKINDDLFRMVKYDNDD